VKTGHYNIFKQLQPTSGEISVIVGTKSNHLIFSEVPLLTPPQNAIEIRNELGLKYSTMHIVLLKHSLIAFVSLFTGFGFQLVSSKQINECLRRRAGVSDASFANSAIASVTQTRTAHNVLVLFFLWLLPIDLQA